jgi:hypothetical protein
MFHMNGYNCYHSPKTGEVGSHGIALVVDERLVSSVVECSPTNIWVRIDTAMHCSMYACSAYIPHRGLPQARKTALAGLAKTIEKFSSRGQVLVMGDFNGEKNKVLKSMHLKVDVKPIPIVGDEKSFNVKGKGTSAIDYMLGTTDVVSLVGECKVKNTIGMSDHWPVISTPCLSLALHYASVSHAAPTRKCFNHKLLPDVRDALLSHNIWNTLAQGEEEDVIVDRDTPKRFHQALSQVVEEVGLLKSGPPKAGKKRTTGRSKAVRSMCKKRDVLYKIAQRNTQDTSTLIQRGEAHRSWCEYRRYCASIRSMCRRDQRYSWKRCIMKGMKLHADMDSDGVACKGFWNWLRLLVRRGKDTSSDAGLVIRDPESGVITAQPHESLKIWERHFKKIYSDGTGHSKDAQYWEGRGEMKLKQCNHLANLDRPLSMMELRNALKKRKTGKATGESMVPADVLKICFGGDADVPLEEEQKAIANACLTAYQISFDAAVLPPVWNESLCAPVPKPGKSVTLLDGFRGVGLGDANLKVLCSILQTRLDDELDKSNFLSECQGGFRPKEQCMSHVVSLYEILVRRKIENMQTYVLFVDFRKAFDMIPHAALFKKLHSAGVRKKFLRFIKLLYANPQVKVKVGGRVSDPVEYMKGVKQGCPLSGTLFNVYINDILEDGRFAGVPVKGVERQEGLLWADDLVVLIESIEALVEVLKALDEWVAVWEMPLGLDDIGIKCAIMPVGVSSQALKEIDQDDWTLGGKKVPVVEKYVYLGMQFNQELDLAGMVAYRAKIVREKLHQLLPTLHDFTLPVCVKLHIVKQFVESTAKYGGELFGMSQKLSKPMAKIVVTALRAAFGVAKNTSKVCLYQEAGMLPMHIHWSVAKTTAFGKWRRSKTVIAKLISSKGHIKSLETRTWVTGTSRWLKTNIRQCDESNKYDEITPYTTQIHDRLKSKFLLPKKKVVISANIYAKYNLGVSAKDMHHTNLYKLNISTHHLRLLSYMRMRQYRTTYKLVCMKVLHKKYKNMCPMCDEHVRETIPHYLLSCRRWDHARTDVWKILGGKYSDGRPFAAEKEQQGAYLLLGGEVGGHRLPGVSDISNPAEPNWLSVTAAFLSDTNEERVRILADLDRVDDSKSDLIPQCCDSNGDSADALPEEPHVGSEDEDELSMSHLPPPDESLVVGIAFPPEQGNII